jgi:hypothetical protein
VRIIAVAMMMIATTATASDPTVHAVRFSLDQDHRRGES